MQRLITFCFLTFTVLLLTSFSRHNKVKPGEDVTAYVYSYMVIKNPTHSETAAVFSPVFSITVNKNDFHFWGDVGARELHSKLIKYIKGDMGKEPVSSFCASCYFFSDSRSEAEDKRQEEISTQRRIHGREIKYTGPDFNFSWHWEKDGGK